LLGFLSKFIEYALIRNEIKEIVKADGFSASNSIERLINDYKLHLKKDGLKKEIYKWELLKKFNGRPNVNAQNLREELSSIDYKNLIYPMGISTIHYLAGERTEPYRKCLMVLFDETKPLVERVKFFNEETLSIYRELIPNTKLSHHHDERTIATILTYHNPEKYTFFKDSFYQKYCKMIGVDAKSKNEKYVHYLELIEELIEEYIQYDEELISIINSSLTVECFPDNLHKILAQDILFTQLDKSIDEVNIEQYAVYKISMGDFSLIEMEELLQQQKILVHEDTKGKGTSTEKQGNLFAKINVGDYFYLTHGNGTNKIKLFGRITSNAINTSYKNYGNDGWLERSYDVIAYSINKSPYKGTNKWWTPNNNSTCIRIKLDEIEQANKLLFEPFFKLRLVSDITSEIETVPDSPTNLKSKQESMNFTLNNILYGPPGTGKTYNTINTALAIIGVSTEGKTRTEIKSEFNSKLKDGKIVFTTFHQSMSYEDFIEGIKPVEPTDDVQSINFIVTDGIFKKACGVAAYNCYKEYSKSMKKVEYSFDDLYDSFITSIQKQIDNQKAPVYKTLRGRDVEVKEINRNDSIIARAKNSVASNSAPLTKENLQKLYDRFKTIDEIKDLQLVQETVQVTPRITEFYAVFSGLKEFEKTYKPDEQLMIESKDVATLGPDEIQKKFNAGVFKEAVMKFGEQAEPVVVVIDEINRGNVSMIFGELITLIEEDKRLGKEEGLEVTLPYSKKTFSVPPNLFIIGTMNTADRSVEALDTALRRRFSFTEYKPNVVHVFENIISDYRKKFLEMKDYDWNSKEWLAFENEFITLLIDKDAYNTQKRNLEKITSKGKEELENFVSFFETYNIKFYHVELMKAINLRIEKLIDTDHMIGHSYFLNINTIDKLKLTLRNGVIPLLQEYFFGDYGKIGLVLGSKFVFKNDNDSSSNIFADFDYQDKSSLENREIYRLADIASMSNEDFTSSNKNSFKDRMIDHRIIVYEHQSLKLGYKGFSNIQLKKWLNFMVKEIVLTIH
jgi:hypothetical protein